MGRRAKAASAAIPEKPHFKIGEVAKIAGVSPAVLRSWEKVFPVLRGAKTGSTQRLYRRRDVELVLEIKRLLRHAGPTVDRARKRLRSRTGSTRRPARARGTKRTEGAKGRKTAVAAYRAVLAEVKREISALCALLASRGDGADARA